MIKVSIKIKVCRKQSAEFHKATIRNLYYLISQLVFVFQGEIGTECPLGALQIAPQQLWHYWFYVAMKSV